MTAVTRTRLLLFGDLGAAEPVVLVHFDEMRQEAVVRVKERCAPASVHVGRSICRGRTLVPPAHNGLLH
jgi:RNase P/RNase MRP subunit POP5